MKRLEWEVNTYDELKIGVVAIEAKYDDYKFHVFEQKDEDKCKYVCAVESCIRLFPARRLSLIPEDYHNVCREIGTVFSLKGGMYKCEEYLDGLIENGKCAEWDYYLKTEKQAMRPYIPGENMDGISVSENDIPQEGGMIARDIESGDKWYVSKEYFEKNYVDYTGEG